MTPLITCSLGNLDALEHALSTLKVAQVPLEHLSLVIPEDRPPENVERHPPSQSPIKPVVDSIMTGVFGGVFGAYAGVVSMLFPGIGLLHAVGPVSIMLGSAAAGAAIGGISSLLMKTGMPSVEAHHQEDLVKQGRILLLIHPGNDHEWQIVHKALVSAGHLDIIEQPQATT